MPEGSGGSRGVQAHRWLFRGSCLLPFRRHPARYTVTLLWSLVARLERGLCAGMLRVWPRWLLPAARGSSDGQRGEQRLP